VVELRVLNGVGRALGDAKARDTVLEALTEQGRLLVGADSLALYLIPSSALLDEQSRQASDQALVLVRQSAGGAREDGLDLALWSLRNERVLRIEDAPRRAPGYGISASSSTPYSWLGVPLDVAGVTQGVLGAVSRRKEAFTEQHEELLGALGRQSIAALEAVRLFEMATVDGLTGLLTARHLKQRLGEEFERACPTLRPLSVIMIDVDRFKSVNDQYGHETGNEVLCFLAEVIVGRLRESDVAARYGGEEFTILLPGTPLQGALDVAERLRTAIESTPVVTSAGTLQITASFGVATFPSVPAMESGEALVAAADHALYRSKREGRNRVTGAG